MNRKGSGAAGASQGVAGTEAGIEYRSRPEAEIDTDDDWLEDLYAGTAPARAVLPDEALRPAAAEGETLFFTVAAPLHGQRLDRALADWIPRHSRSHLQQLVEAGAVTVDGVAALLPSRRLTVGQRVRIELSLPLAQRAFEPEVMDLDVRLQDEQVLVLCKPAGLVVHPAAGNWTGTLLNGLLALDPALARLPRAGIVHRLDKDTSGLMVVARTPLAMTHLVRALAAHEVRRTYQAIAQGDVPRSLERVDAPIGRDPRVRTRMAVVASGKPARTDVERVGGNGLFSRLSCRLHTGRTHQIRVHLAQAGHPLVADALYGGRPALGLARQALHACRLRFEHPTLGLPVEVAADPPADFAQAWAQLTD